MTLGRVVAFTGVPVPALHALLGWHVLLGLSEAELPSQGAPQCPPARSVALSLTSKPSAFWGVVWGDGQGSVDADHHHCLLPAAAGFHPRPKAAVLLSPLQGRDFVLDGTEETGLGGVSAVAALLLPPRQHPERAFLQTTVNLPGEHLEGLLQGSPAVGR